MNAGAAVTLKLTTGLRVMRQPSGAVTITTSCARNVPLAAEEGSQTIV
jgi:hypothetical protein